MRPLTLALAILLVVVATSRLGTAYPTYANKVPNGNGVQSPCNADELWPGVGHLHQAGGGPRNPFGLDLKAEGFKWTQQLCRKDSDGDGRTNGEELGDPECVWQEGGKPSRTDNVTHPGICEPVGSEKCAKLNGEFKCPEQFNCSAIHQPGVRQMSLRLNRTEVPPKETTYMCQAYEVSNRTKEHMIAAVPVIDNPAVLHHMIIYGCTQKPNVALDSPFECGMSAANCFNLIDLWGLGMRPGNCYRDDVGAPFGLEGYQYVVLQLHWNNPAEVTNWFDASGFELYFSPKLRQYDTGVMMYGQAKLDLAPRQKEIYRTATSDSRSSKELLPQDGGYKLLWGTLHMHLYGTRGQVSLWRNGQKVRDLIPMHNFDYDTPIVFEYQQPIDYLPGDEIRTDCYYSTAKTNRSVYWGESTQEEMCYSFFQYFPHNRTKAQSWPNVDLCTSFGKIDYCVTGLQSVKEYIVDGCDVKTLQSGQLIQKYKKDIDSECRHAYQYRCSDQCLAWYRSVKASEPCFNGDPIDYILLYTRALAGYLDLCAERDQRDKLQEAKAEIDELNKRSTPAPEVHNSLLSHDIRLLIVSASYLAGLLLAALLVLVIFRMKRSSVASIESKGIHIRLGTAYPTYANKVPNGNGVQSPCNADELWPGVGHLHQAGGGPRNPFGLDLKAEGFKWTQQLCRKDSDGDGRTNGEELGDPKGGKPSRTDNVTHPGICEPVGSEKCAKLNGEFKCPEQFNCSAIHQSGVRQMSLRLNRTEVPPKETTYMCQAYEVSNRTKEHMIAAVPVIDNPAVLHHLAIFGCKEKPNVPLETPFECGMSAANCFSLIDLWSLGMPGNCYRDDVGAPFGLEGYQYAVVQLHWSNPAEVTNWFDASGFELYFSPTPRQYDTGVMMYGQAKLDLAPRQKEIYRTATSDSRTSKELLPQDGGYKLLWGIMHMHLYGTRGQVSLWRNGQKVRDLIPMHNYDYNTPIVLEYQQPIDYLPGDEIRTDCYYSTAKTNRSVYWGESTQEEMCYSFFQYFPHNLTKSHSWPNIDACSSFGKVDYCVMGLKSVEKYIVDGCDVKTLQSGQLIQKYKKGVDSECRHAYQYRCSDQCLAWYRSVKASEPCFNGDPIDYILLYTRYSSNGDTRALAGYLDLCAERDQRDKLQEAKAEIDELNKRSTPAPEVHNSLLSHDIRLLIVSASYLAGLLLAALLVLVIFRMKRSSVASIESKGIHM
uniref:DBH-like monooxygenase protein 1 n=2 Tax=Macrostomum lignano TaxID=282301 RepID=A0A1I8HY55_9PLAT